MIIHTSCSPVVASPRSPSNEGFLLLVKDMGMVVVVVVGSEFTDDSAAPLLANIIGLGERNMIVLGGSPLPELGTG